MTWSLITNIFSTFLAYLNGMPERHLTTNQINWRAQVNQKIVGGVYITIKSAPHQVSMQFMRTHICGGSIISAKWVLTAAHCVSDMPVEDFRIHSGSSFRYITGRNHQVKQILVADDYDDLTDGSDIALIEVVEPFKTKGRYEHTIMLPAIGAKPIEGTLATTTGWGTVMEGWNIPPMMLKLVTLRIQNWKTCKRTYARLQLNLTRAMLCAGSKRPGQDSCQGDSGGPLVSDKVLVGVVSTGVGCGVRGHPGIYTCVASFRKWIKKHTGV